MIEPLEPRRLMSVSLANGVLMIVGTPGPDTLSVRFLDTVSPTGGGLLQVNDDGVVSKYDANGVTSIEIHAGVGNDRVVLAGTLQPATVFGGHGADTIRTHGGAGHNLLLGGRGTDSIAVDDVGADTLQGGLGRDMLVATNGADLLQGGPGNDSLQGDGVSTLLGGSGNDIIQL